MHTVLMHTFRFISELPDPILTGPRLEGLWYQECKGRQKEA